MGLIIAKFRKKTSTYDVLLKLENEITSIEDFQKRTEKAQRKIIFRFILLAVLLYLLLVFLLYLFYSQVSSDQKVTWILPLVIFPLVIYIAKCLLSWYYSRKIRKNEKKVITLKEQKKKLLENVMETETYKVAKKILDKFGEKQKPVIPSTPTVVKASPGPLSTYSKGQLEPRDLRQRIVVQNAMRGAVSFSGVPEIPLTPVQRRQLALPSTPSTMMVPTPSRALATPRNMSIAPLPLACNILPRERSVLDKMVDYLVGDGPSNRYALICQQCSSHNGMALKEEFEYISFRCCYCSHFNPSRKKKPAGPKFESPAITSSGHESSDSDMDSDSDSDSKPLVTEPDDVFKESPKETSPLYSSGGETGENIEKMEIVEPESETAEETEAVNIEAENDTMKELVENLEASNI